MKIWKCPYCKRKVYCCITTLDINPIGKIIGYQVRCNNEICGARGPIRKKEKGAIDAWNILILRAMTTTIS